MPRQLTLAFSGRQEGTLVGRLELSGYPTQIRFCSGISRGSLVEPVRLRLFLSDDRTKPNELPVVSGICVLA